MYKGFVTGAAPGVDTLCHYLAYAWRREAEHTLIVPNGKHNKDVVFFAMAMDIEVIAMPEGTDHLDRNSKMIGMADALLAFPGGSTELFRGSGTWSTIRRARKKGIPIYSYPLDKSDPWRENV
jgi:predicted Rossmann-fold nucleotide-binding protein